MKPPIADRIDHIQTCHGIKLKDPYHWLKDTSYPEVNDARVLDYLKAENDYFTHRMAPHQPLIATLFEELKARQPEQDESVPYQRGQFWYRWRYEKNAQYRIWLRAAIDSPEDWKVILDEPALALEQEYFNLGGLSVSPDGRYLIFASNRGGSQPGETNLFVAEWRAIPPVAASNGGL